MEKEKSAMGGVDWLSFVEAEAEAETARGFYVFCVEANCGVRCV